MLVSPFSFEEPGPLTMELSVELERIARQNDVAYVDATRWLTTDGDVISPEGLHPTAQDSSSWPCGWSRSSSGSAS